MVKSVSNLLKVEEENRVRLMEARELVSAELKDRKVHIDYRDNLGYGYIRKVNFSSSTVEVVITNVSAIETQSQRCTPEGHPIVNVYISEINSPHFKLLEETQ